MTTSFVVALVGFDPAFLEQCRAALENQGYAVFDEPDTEKALAGFSTRRSDLAKPDVWALGPLEPVPFLIAVQKVRGHPLAAKAGILAVNEKLTADEAAAVLNAGADDCYRKPFIPAIFSARVRGILRRRGEEKAAADDPNLWRFGPGLELHLIQRSVAVDQLRVPLSRGQFDLLACLAQSAGKAVPAAQLIAILAKSLLYVNATHLKREIEQIQAKLLRFGPWLAVLPDGSYRFQEPSQ
ncbi:MAG: response regulator transcription factor [Elusimicrobia bacterium]|nr:response regulator transcription factor [Elusimicrobiota bacterium]